MGFVQSGSDGFQVDLVQSGLTKDISIMIKISSESNSLGLLLLAYPKKQSTSCVTLVNTRNDDLEVVAKKYASRLANTVNRPVMLSLEMPSPDEGNPEMWVRYMKDIDIEVQNVLRTCNLS